MTFDHPTDATYPVTAAIAVDRAQAMVRRPISISYPISIVLGVWVFGLGFRSLSFFPFAFVGCWLYWSYLIPRWRRWAVSIGIDPEELQRIGEAKHLIWRRGSWLEKTEFR